MINFYKKKDFILHCSLIDGIGPVAVQQVTKLLERFAVADLYRFNVSDFVQQSFSFSVAQKLVCGLADASLLEKQLAAIEKHTIAWTTLGAQNYPPLLATIYAPPPILYWKGKSPHRFEKNIALVGSRQANQYAQQVINSIVETAALHDITIVSGGAIGADTMAHTAAVHAQGNTIVVLGSGLAHYYPLSNARLFEKVQEQYGTVLSIFPVNAPAFAGNFPARNRVIAGLSQVCVVVQAAQKSGALITAHDALEQGREVMAVPGPINDPLHDGCHALIQQGAGLVHNAYDVLAHFGIEKPVIREQVAKKIREPVSKLQIPPSMTIKTDNNVLSTLSQKQNIILAACKTPCNIDELSLVTSIAMHELYAEVLTLQMQSFLVEDLAGRLCAVSIK